MKRLIAVLGLILALGATACGTETVIRERVVTVTAPPSVSPSVSPVVEASPSSEPVTLATTGDVRACELVRLALTREANSPSWIDIMNDAGFKARDYDLQDAIDKAYWTSGDALAEQRTRDAEAICSELNA